jgi:hypothetical protein
MRVRPVAVAVALAMAGCGGGSGTPPPEETAVRNTVQRWLAAVVHHDDAAACALSSAQLHKAIDRHLLGEGVAGSCRDWAARWVSPRHAASLRGARIGTVRIAGPRATVTLAARGAPDSHAKLVKEDGHWRIDDF